MDRRLFLLVTALIILGGAWGLKRQRAAIAEARVALASIEKAPVAAPSGQKPRNRTPPRADHPSSELLRLRAEVTQLRRDLDSPPQKTPPPQQWAEDWALVHSGPKPSQQIGFVYFTNVTNVGFSTPEHALQSFNFAMRNQRKDPMTPTRMKELWDVPDDFDDPNAPYSINMGEGMGSEMGYRIVSQEMIGTNQVRLTLDYEKPDGSSFRRQKILVSNQGRWRMKPEGVSRNR